MDVFNPYLGVIAVCIILIFSYNFNIVSKYTNIPSVLLLIGLGIAVKEVLVLLNIDTGEYIHEILELVGIVGLIMIVLEATIELELKKENKSLILKSFLIAFVSLIATSIVITYIIHTYIVSDVFVAMLYAVPFSIMSSAIIIPSIASLSKKKREFLIYESAFSDILGIMFFYFMLDNAEATSVGSVFVNISVNIVTTVAVAVIVSYFMVWLLQRINSQVKLVLLISVLIMLYATAKMLHLSSLIIILIFGLVLDDYKVFFVGKLHSLINEERLKAVVKDFHLMTMESSFLVRTFFFVIFGISLDLNHLLDMDDAIISIIIVAAILIVRLVILKIFGMRDIFPNLFLAPRGLITILLFFGIPATYQFDGFSPGILLYTIILTTVLMALALVIKGKEKPKYDVLSFGSWDDLDREIDELGGKRRKK